MLTFSVKVPKVFNSRSFIRYKFRLYITCPAPIANIENAKNRKNVTSFVDITISTNKPPVPQRLEVTPLSGNGMSTVFKFSTGVASDDEFDYPLKYTFYYVVNNITITIGEFFESMVSTAVLPYSGIVFIAFKFIFKIKTFFLRIAN